MTAPAVEPRELTAGRELDALVAEKVFGAREHQGGPYWIYPEAVPPAPAGLHILRSYSTHLDAAWTILERIHTRTTHVEDFWTFSKRSRFYRALEDLCVVDGFHVAWPDALGIFRERMPEFICLAALKAVAA